MSDSYQFEFMVRIEFAAGRTHKQAQEEFTCWVCNNAGRSFDIVEHGPIKKVINPAKQIGRAGVGRLRIISERSYANGRG